jgi:hypothetical protein
MEWGMAGLLLRTIGPATMVVSYGLMMIIRFGLVSHQIAQNLS